MPETRATTQPGLRTPAIDDRAGRALTDFRRFTLLALPLALLLLVFRAYLLEQPAFSKLAYLVFGGFAVNYWLPFRLKQLFLILLSLAGAYFLMSAEVASLLFAIGLALFAIIRTQLSFRLKVVLLLVFTAFCAYCRAGTRFGVPREFWPLFGSIFMFRMIVFMYDTKHLQEPIRLKDYLGYFFLLPNYYFLLFPVIDFQTFRKSYFKRDIHTVAQQGIWRLFRGTTHLLLYRVIYQVQGRFSPPHVPIALAVVAKAVFSYLLYLRISGQFHIAVGMLCLFGYDLPETNRYYLLASSINDFWRRINIYWKDFMVKVFYFPVYFRLRRQGELRAQILATIWVFVVTWFLHAVQFFWLQGKFRTSANDAAFWVILCCLVVGEVYRNHRRPKRLPGSGWTFQLQHAVQIAATFALISFLWSMWSSNSMVEWLYFLKTGNV
jgi:alginate O-acetyltransferase complex protein AlgI